MLHPQKAVSASWSIDEAMLFAEQLIVDRHLEVKSVGIEVVGRSIPRTTLRYAIERFPPARRVALLKETRNGK
jgi:hypothetical protein